MYCDFLVDIPDVSGRMTRLATKGATYINYQYDRVYDPERQFNIPKRATIGKQSGSDGSRMYPNQNYFRFFPDKKLPEEHDNSFRSSCLRIGAYLVISKIIGFYELDEILGPIIGKDSGLLLDLAAYSIVCENNAGQYYPEYAFNHPLFTAGMRMFTDSKVSAFLSSITIEKRVGFLNKWNSKCSKKDLIYITYDSTNKNTQAGDLELAEFGHPKDDKGLPVVNYSVAYDLNDRLPLFYEDYPGSIVDISQLTCMVEKARAYGYRKLGFILDRGYFSRGNIQFMDKCKYEFVIMVKGMKSLVSELILSSMGTFENKRACFIKDPLVYGTTVQARLYASDTKDRYFHIFHSITKKGFDQLELGDKLKAMACAMDKLIGKAVVLPQSYTQYYEILRDPKSNALIGYIEKQEAVEREMSLCGYFAIITSQRMTASEACGLYDSRDASEKLFRGDKSYLGNNSFRTGSDESTSGKIFIEFIALIVRNRFYYLLRDERLKLAKSPNYMTVPAAIRELEKIEMIRQFDGVYRLDHAVTATQRTILKAFAMEADDIKNSADSLSGMLSPESKGASDGQKKKQGGN